MSDGSELYAWQVQEADGRWGVISMGYQLDLGPERGGLTPKLHLDVLIHRDLDVARRIMGPIAAKHRQAEGKPIRLARFQITDVLVKRGGLAHG